MSQCQAQGVCWTLFMIPSTQCEPCLFFMRLGAHDLITLSARRKEREHLNCLYRNKTNRKTHTPSQTIAQVSLESRKRNMQPICLCVCLFQFTSKCAWTVHIYLSQIHLFPAVFAQKVQKQAAAAWRLSQCMTAFSVGGQLAGDRAHTNIFSHITWHNFINTNQKAKLELLSTGGY